MPAKKPSLFEVTGKEPPKPKAPTLRQYLKENTDATYPLIARVNTIWFPGNWENYSIETPEFRCSIGGNHPLFTILENSIVKLLNDSENALLLVVMDNEGTIGFSESNVYGKYARIGNAGYRFEETPGAN